MKLLRVGDALVRAGQPTLQALSIPTSSFASSQLCGNTSSLDRSKSFFTTRHLTSCVSLRDEYTNLSKAEKAHLGIKDIMTGMPLISGKGDSRYNRRRTKIEAGASKPTSGDLLRQASMIDRQNPIAQRQRDLLSEGATSGVLNSINHSVLTSGREVRKMKDELPPLRMHPYLGRCEPVIRSQGLGRALDRLRFKVASNRIRGDFASQKFHERPGLKRKRLRRERWKKRFKEGFQATVAKVEGMRRQGW